MFALLVGPGQATAQTTLPDTVTVDYTHVLKISGDSTAISAEVLIFTDQGLFDIDADSLTYLSGYRYWAAGSVTHTLVSAGALFAEEVGGGQNGASLAGLEAGFEPITFETRQADAHADITTTVTVSTCSDPDLEQVCIEAVSEGSAAYPDIVDVDWTTRFAQIPKAGGGFNETGTQYLVAADGSVIRSKLSATYPAAFDLQTPQVRHVGLEVESEAGDYRSVSLDAEIRVTDRAWPVSGTLTGVLNGDSLNGTYAGTARRTGGSYTLNLTLSDSVQARRLLLEPVVHQLLTAAYSREQDGAANLIRLADSSLTASATVTINGPASTGGKRGRSGTAGTRYSYDLDASLSHGDGGIDIQASIDGTMPPASHLSGPLTYTDRWTVEQPVLEAPDSARLTINRPFRADLDGDGRTERHTVAAEIRVGGLAKPLPGRQRVLGRGLEVVAGASLGRSARTRYQELSAYTGPPMSEPALSGLPVRPVGGIAFTPSSDHTGLQLHNLGLKGEERAGIEPASDRQFKTIDLPIEPDSLQFEDSGYVIGARAKYADTTGVPIGTARLVHEAGSIRVRANFDPIGADSAELILRENGEITGWATFPTGGDLAAYPAEAPFISDIQGAAALPGRNVPQNSCRTDGPAVCVSAGFQATRSVTLSNGALVQADELVLIPRGVSEPFRPERLTGLSRFEIGGTNIERLVLRSASATYPLRGPDIRGTLAGRLSGHEVEGTYAGAIDTVSGKTDLYVMGLPPAVGERLRLALSTSHLIGAAYGPRSSDAVNLGGITGDSITARTEVRVDEDLAGPEGDSLYAVETVLKRSSEIIRVDAQISGGLPRVSQETDLTWASAAGNMRPVGPDSLAEVFNRAVRGDFDGDGTPERHVLELTMQVGSVETSLPGVQRIGAAGLQTSFADSISRWENERTGLGPGRERARLDGIPLRAVGDALLRARSGGSEYRIENTGLGGDDGARLSAPTDTAYRDLTAEFEPVPIPTAKPQAPQIRWDRSGLYLSLQGTYPDSARIPIGQARLAVRAGTTRVVADFTPVGADYVRLISLQNGAVSGTATVPGEGMVAWRSGRDVTVRTVSGSPHSCNGSGEAVPCLGYKFQYSPSFTAADGTVLEGNELLIRADNPSGPFAEGGLEGITELRIGASNLEPLLLTTLTGDPESTPIPARAADLPDQYRLEQNYPNPFNPSTTIRYALPEASQVTLTVYDILGRQVRRLVDGQRAAGRHKVRFDAKGLPSGLYFYRLQAGSVIRTLSMILAK